MQIFVAGVIARSLIPIKEGHTVYAMIRNESQVEAMKKVDALPVLAERGASKNKARKENGYFKIS